MKKFVQDVASNYLVYGAQIVVSLLAIPVYISTYGDELYGVYLLSVGLAQSLLFLDFGSGKALLRYVTVFLETKEERVYGAALRTCFSITLASAAAVFLLFFIIAYFRAMVFTIPDKYLSVALALFIGSGVYSVLLMIRQLPLAMLRGASIFYHRNTYVAINVLLRGLLVLLVFLLEINVLWLLASEVFLILLDIFIDLTILRKYARELLRVDLLAAPIDRLKRLEVFKYAKETFYLSAVGFFSQNSDKIVIGLFLPVEFVTVYTVITKPYQVLKSLLSRVYVVLQPHYVRLYSRGLKKKLVDFVSTSGVFLAYLLLPFLVAGILFFSVFISYWLGTTQYEPYYLYGQLLLGVTGCRVLTTMVYQAVYVNGGTGSLFRLEILTVATNLAVSIVGVQLIGLGGVIIGTCLQLLMVLPLLLPVCRRFFAVSVNEKGFRSLYGNYLGLILLYTVVVAFSAYAQSVIANDICQVLLAVGSFFFASVLLYLMAKDKMQKAFVGIKHVVQIT